MKRLIFGFIGAYVLVAALLSIDFSANSQFDHMQNVPSTKKIALSLPFTLKDLEDASYDSLLAIGTYASQYIKDSIATIGALAVAFNNGIESLDSTLASSSRIDLPQKTYVTEDTMMKRGHNLVTETTGAIKTNAQDIGSYFTEMKIDGSNLKENMLAAVNYISDNLTAITKFDDNLAASAAIPENEVATAVLGASSTQVEIYSTKHAAQTKTLLSCANQPGIIKNGYNNTLIIDPSKCKIIFETE